MKIIEKRNNTLVEAIPVRKYTFHCHHCYFLDICKKRKIHMMCDSKDRHDNQDVYFRKLDIIEIILYYLSRSL